MIKLLDLLKENTQSKYNYGCVMLYFDFPKIKEIHNIIKKEDIYEEEGDKTFGLEDESHCTLLYGLHEEVTLDEVKQTLSKFTYYPCTIYNASIFENEKYDVLKFDVKGKNLHETNDALKKFPFTSDWPDYHPHMTIGYIQSGLGHKYVQKLKGLEFELIPKNAIYSQPDGTKTNINIKVKQ